MELALGSGRSDCQDHQQDGTNLKVNKAGLARCYRSNRSVDVNNLSIEYSPEPNHFIDAFVTLETELTHSVPTNQPTPTPTAAWFSLFILLVIKLWLSSYIAPKDVHSTLARLVGSAFTQSSTTAQPWPSSNP